MMQREWTYHHHHHNNNNNNKPPDDSSSSHILTSSVASTAASSSVVAATAAARNNLHRLQNHRFRPSSSSSASASASSSSQHHQHQHHHEPTVFEILQQDIASLKTKVDQQLHDMTQNSTQLFPWTTKTFSGVWPLSPLYEQHQQQEEEKDDDDDDHHHDDANKHGYNKDETESSTATNSVLLPLPGGGVVTSSSPPSRKQQLHQQLLQQQRHPQQGQFSQNVHHDGDGDGGSSGSAAAAEKATILTRSTRSSADSSSSSSGIVMTKPGAARHHHYHRQQHSATTMMTKASNSSAMMTTGSSDSRGSSDESSTALNNRRERNQQHHHRHRNKHGPVTFARHHHSQPQTALHPWNEANNDDENADTEEEPFDEPQSPPTTPGRLRDLKDTECRSPGALREQASPRRNHHSTESSSNHINPLVTETLAAPSLTRTTVKNNNNNSTKPVLPQRVVLTSVPSNMSIQGVKSITSVSSRGGKNSQYTNRTTTSTTTERMTNLTKHHHQRQRRRHRHLQQQPEEEEEEEASHHNENKDDSDNKSDKYVLGSTTHKASIQSPDSSTYQQQQQQQDLNALPKEDPYHLAPLVELALAGLPSSPEESDPDDVAVSSLPLMSSTSQWSGYKEEIETVYKEPVTRISATNEAKDNGKRRNVPQVREEKPYVLSPQDDEHQNLPSPLNKEELPYALSDDDRQDEHQHQHQHHDDESASRHNYKKALEAHEEDFVDEIQQEMPSRPKGRSVSPIEEGQEIIVLEDATSSEDDLAEDLPRKEGKYAEEAEGVIHYDLTNWKHPGTGEINPVENASVSDIGSPTSTPMEGEDKPDEKEEENLAPLSQENTKSILAPARKTRRKFFPDDEDDEEDDDDQTKEASVISRKSTVSWADEVRQKNRVDGRVEAGANKEQNECSNDPTPRAIQAAVSQLTMSPSESVENYLENKIDLMNNKRLETIERSRQRMEKFRKLEPEHIEDRSTIRSLHLDDENAKDSANLFAHSSRFLSLKVGQLEAGETACNQATLELAWKKMMERRDAPSIHSAQHQDAPDPSASPSPLLSHEESNTSSAHSKPATIQIPMSPYHYNDNRDEEKKEDSPRVLVKQVQTPSGHRLKNVVRLEQVTDKTIRDPYGDYGLYTGILLRDKPHGQGSMKYADGRSYIGQWKLGRWNGHGRVTYTNGDIYSGQWKMDKRHGVGRYEWKDGRVYDGEFKNDQREGRGTFHFPNGSVYTGEFRAGQRHGQGCYKFHDSAIYNGEFKNGKYDGIGECIWAEGRCYLGEWVAGQAHGYGIEIREDGTIRHDGEWCRDRPVRKKKSKTVKSLKHPDSSTSTSTARSKSRRPPTPERLRSLSKDESDKNKCKEWRYPTPGKLRLQSKDESDESRSKSRLESVSEAGSHGKDTRIVEARSAVTPSKYSTGGEPIWSTRIKAKKESVKTKTTVSNQKLLSPIRD